VTRSWSCLALVISLSVGPAIAAAQESAAGLDVKLGIKVPLRDGVRLNATLYLPKDLATPAPTVLAMTPYIADRYHNFVTPLAKRGYVVAVVDVRGRGSSEGVFDPFAQEAKDGYDTIEWIAKQSWSNGKIAMMGGSYGGFNQWTIVKELPPHLTTIAPTASAHLGVDFPNDGGIGSRYQMAWISFTTGKTGNGNLFGDAAYWSAKYREMYLNHLPYAVLDSVAGNPSPSFQKWLQHRGYDGYWASMAPSPEQLAKISIPIFSRTGMYDGDQIGAMEHYRNHMKHGSAEAKAKHYLMIGPWDHAGTRVPQKTFGGLTFGDASMVDMGALEASWYDWTMRAGPPPPPLKKRVSYYVTGAEVWKYADNLEEIGGHLTKYFLTSPGKAASDVFRSGSLTDRQPPATAPDEWTYDPLDTKPGASEPDDSPDYADPRWAVELGERGLVYHSAPLPGDTEISGFPKLTIWLTSDVPDTDLFAGLYEITATGQSILLDDVQLRLRYREGRDREVMMVPGQATKVEMNGWRFMSRRLKKGSRIRLLIMSPNTIQLEKNYNAGGAVAWETAKDARTAHLRLLHEQDRWSALELPVVPVTM
jgi:putative CocE/NonD family hydrolase